MFSLYAFIHASLTGTFLKLNVFVFRYEAKIL